MSKPPTYPDDDWITAARATVAQIHESSPSRDLLLPELVKALYAMKMAADRGDWREAATSAGMVCTLALVLQQDAIARMHRQAKA